MVVELALGALVIGASIVVQVAFIGAVVFGFERLSHRLAQPPRAVKIPIGLAIVSLWLMAAHGVAVWIWAALFTAVGAFESLETALYFAVVCFTTLGFGDITPQSGWRALSGLCAANGLLAFGVSTAFLVELLRRMWTASEGGSQKW